jgi:hypothetical protein
LAHKIQVSWHIGFFLAHSLCAKKFNFSWHINYVPENNFLGFVAHILCAIKIYWHLVYVPRNNFLDIGIADVYPILVINAKMSFLGI